MNEQSIDFWIERARIIATLAHEGQTRRNGGPYIEHPARIATRLPTILKPIGWLHDVVEDTKVTLDNLKKEGFPDYIVKGVQDITHWDGQTNIQYWTKISKNEDAVIVKLYDIQDNLAGSPSEYARQKYAKALAFFKERGFSLDKM